MRTLCSLKFWADSLSLIKKLCVTVAVACSAAAQAGVVTTAPGDNEPLPAGTELGLLYYQHAERDKVNVNGRAVTQNFSLNSDIGIARFVHWTTLGGFTVTPQIILPFGRLSLGGTSSQTATGFGDPMIGSAIWLLNDKDKERYFSLAGFVGLPAGSYDPAKASMNLGENRWKGVAEVNWVQALISKRLHGEITFEYDTFGANNNFAGTTLRQDNIFELQTHLRYVLNPADQVGLSYYHTIGGGNNVNGIAQQDSLKTDRYMVTWAHFFTPGLQLQTQAGQDLYVRNGTQEKFRLNFRLARAF